MKAFIKLLSILIFFLTITISAQKTTWLDADLKETNKVKSYYYKVVPTDGNEVKYYYKSGNIFRKIGYSEGKYDGVFSEFYESGELRTSGTYVDGLEEGVWKTYYKNGKNKEKGKYTKGEKVGVWKTFYKNF
ncbi:MULTISPECIES: toxin-antitoxin system YwqK family antitoxin [unclassified Polaribacter]|jgi:antitoxin component YwqK of YwqJK toxin-antitoxin module|uniref:toxin-antitoxin system YwqK family antitoxin n=1 Tax=unclassified Polaribacter TaxID=196858 RepID=UPI001C4ECE0B|nr:MULTISPECIES: hypothetical protein [unclassified Polaribacter]QXP66681.1 hypothetical protein H0I28_16185 [Polaribacter sp. AHE13PA]QXP72167.1 hypothetical protein H0I29_08925 [Polaribacter sp. R2A056_3_33]